MRLPEDLRRLLVRVDPLTLRQLRQNSPGWNENDPICPQCACDAAQAARRQPPADSLQEALLLPYPVYAPEEARLIPVHQFVDAPAYYSGEDVTIAFLDSGFHPHPDLIHPANRILRHVDATAPQPVETENFSRPLAASWHGLMTSCVAAGNGSLSEGRYRGIAYRAGVVLVKTGSPGSRSIREDDIRRALQWVIENQRRFNIRVVNISLGGDYSNKEQPNRLAGLVAEAVERGLIVVAAAGNEGSERLAPPASVPAAITVGGLDNRNSFDRRRWRLYPSNYGKTAGGGVKPEITAPARWLAAPMLPNSTVHNEGKFLWSLSQILERLLDSSSAARSQLHGQNGSQIESTWRKLRQRMIEQKYIHPHYQHVDGTSMAAPVVSGVIALMLEANPALTPAQVKDILMKSAAPLAGFPAERVGAGLVHASRAIAGARRFSRSIWESTPFSPHVAAEQITFYYFDPGNRASRVRLVGSFNGWNAAGYELTSRSPGFWQLSIPPLPPGKYIYKFLIDDAWSHDPENPTRIADGFGGFNSILEVTI